MKNTVTFYNKNEAVLPIQGPMDSENSQPVFRKQYVQDNHWMLQVVSHKAPIIAAVSNTVTTNFMFTLVHIYSMLHRGALVHKAHRLGSENWRRN